MLQENLESLLKDLADRSWANDELSWHPDFILKPSDLANVHELEGVVKTLLAHARKIAPKFSVPYMVPKVVIESKITGVGQFEIDEDGWVIITVSPKFFDDKLAAQAILSHEVCHYILANSGIHHDNLELNERYTDLCMFACGFGEVFLSGYKRESAQQEDRPGHQFGYLSDAEYQFTDRYIKSLRESHQRQLSSPLTALEKQLLKLTNNDRNLVNRLIQYERSKSPTKSEIFLYEQAIDRLISDRR
jgi:hypothetical protein